MRFAVRALCAVLLILALAGGPARVPARAAPVDLFSNFNTNAVMSGPMLPTTFTLIAAAMITQIVTYHYNAGHGAGPGSIGLLGEGQSFGPFPAVGTAAQGGEPTSWVANVHLTLAPGTYMVTDSDLFTWSYNAQSQGRGFATLRGTYLSALCADVSTILYTNYPSTTSQPMQNGGVPPTFTLQNDGCITEILTYHWNNGQGAAPGTIWLLSTTGVAYGPFQAVGVTGQDDVPNAIWVINVRLGLPAASYWVYDSDSTTWSSNTQSNGAGLVTVLGQD
jgi:hypothetical protein